MLVGRQMKSSSEIGKVILLNGASSAGKSTLALAIQDQIDQPFWHVSIDHLRDGGVLPMKRIKRRDFLWRDIRGAFFEGFEASLVAYLQAGNNLIVEYIMENRDWLTRTVNLLNRYDVFFVGVRCDVDELESREIRRGNRPIGDARRDYGTVHEFCVCDAEVDGRRSAETNAETLIELWRKRSHPSAFDRLVMELGVTPTAQ